MPETVICTPSLTDTDTSTGATTPGTVVVVVLVVVGDEVAVGVVVVVVVSAVGANRQRNPRVLVCTHVNPRPETPSRAVAPPRTHTAPSAGAALACFTPEELGGPCTKGGERYAVMPPPAEATEI